jgi:hypothetical protein
MPRAHASPKPVCTHHAGSETMHDYTARILHEDRMKEFRREADGTRFAAQIRDARQTLTAPAANSGRLANAASRFLAWWRRQAQAYRLRGRLGPAADAQLGEDV